MNDDEGGAPGSGAHPFQAFGTDQTADELLQFARGSIEQWMASIQQISYRTPVAGGQMVHDQAEVGQADYGYRAWRPVQQATVHLDAAFALADEDQGAVWPTSHRLLARAALIGAAKVIYILRPNSSRERVTRALQLAQSELASIQRANTDLIRIVGAASTDLVDNVDSLRLELDDVPSRLRKHRLEIRDLLTGRGVPSKFAADGIGDGLVLREAAEAFDDDHQRLAIATAWHEGSMAAHATMAAFTLHDQAESRALPEETFADILGPPVLLVHGAWQLWEHRRDEVQSAHRGMKKC